MAFNIYTCTTTSLRFRLIHNQSARIISLISLFFVCLCLRICSLRFDGITNAIASSSQQVPSVPDPVTSRVRPQRAFFLLTYLYRYQFRVRRAWAIRRKAMRKHHMLFLTQSVDFCIWSDLPIETASTSYSNEETIKGPHAPSRRGTVPLPFIWLKNEGLCFEVLWLGLHFVIVTSQILILRAYNHRDGFFVCHTDWIMLFLSQQLKKPLLEEDNAWVSMKRQSSANSEVLGQHGSISCCCTKLW